MAKGKKSRRGIWRCGNCGYGGLYRKDGVLLDAGWVRLRHKRFCKRCGSSNGG